jgi:hypothetical protein
MPIRITIPEFLVIDDVSGMCPVQGEGTVGGLPFYFRARHCGWSFSVAETPDGDPIDVSIGRAKGFFKCGEWGEGAHDAGFMSADVAEKIIRECAEEYRTSLENGART